MNDDFIEVTLCSDGNDNYIIPTELSLLFEEILEIIGENEYEENVDEYYYIDLFISKFSKYRTGGAYNVYQLYITKDELKKLTGES